MAVGSGTASVYVSGLSRHLPTRAGTPRPCKQKGWDHIGPTPFVPI
jgi:hypothetical protein